MVADNITSTDLLNERGIYGTTVVRVQMLFLFQQQERRNPDHIRDTSAFSIRLSMKIVVWHARERHRILPGLTRRCLTRLYILLIRADPIYHYLLLRCLKVELTTADQLAQPPLQLIFSMPAPLT